MPQNIFKIYGGANSFWQWETDQKLIVLDETIDKVHFSNKYMRRAFTVNIYVDADGLRVCDIPDEMLTIPKNLIATAYDNEGVPDEVIRSVQFAVKARPIPYDYKAEQGDQASGVMQFNTLAAAEKWALDTKKVGSIIAVNIDSVWTACIVGEDCSVNTVWDQEYVLDSIDHLNYLVGDAKVETVVENHNLETRKYVDQAISNIKIPEVEGFVSYEEEQILSSAQRARARKNIHAIETVNGISPDENGNIDITIPDDHDCVYVLSEDESIENIPDDVDLVIDLYNNNDVEFDNKISDAVDAAIEEAKKSGSLIKIDESLSLSDAGILSVKTTNQMEQDNTLPITSAGVYATVGNIEALLKTI